MSDGSSELPASPLPTHATLATRLCALVGVDLPIVQTGMGWVSGARLTSATAESGGLGFLATVTMTLDELRTAIGKVRDRTDRPFGINVRADQADLAQRLAVGAEADVIVVSFAGAATRDAISAVHDVGAVAIATVGRRRHAEKMAEWGIDAVIAQGGEGGGHTGDVPTSLLVPDVVDAIGGQIPVIAAGGMFDGRSLIAALAWGADGIAMGTRFLLTRESHVPDEVKQHYLAAAVTDTVRTTGIDGSPQRVIATDVIAGLERAPIRALPAAVANAVRFARDTGTPIRTLLREGRAMRHSQELTWTQLVMAANAPMMTKAAMVDGRLDAGILPSGQVCGVIDAIPSVAEVMRNVVTEAITTLHRLEGSS
ncbi:MAG TPA: nitronate monooxygenase [Acidimicrobiales bacterium]